jgi:hypothetical protein
MHEKIENLNKKNKNDLQKRKIVSNIKNNYFFIDNKVRAYIYSNNQKILANDKLDNKELILYSFNDNHIK